MTLMTILIPIKITMTYDNDADRRGAEVDNDVEYDSDIDEDNDY